MARVYLAQCAEYRTDLLDAAVAEAFEVLGLDEKIQPGMRVVIKPNLIMRSKSEAGIITHPAVTAAVGRRVKARGASVLIVESPGGPYSPGIMKSNFAHCGYTAMAQENGFELYTACASREVTAPKAQRCRQFTIVEPFLTADLIIDIAKLKTHGMMLFSGAVKNLFGTVPGLLKPELHCRFPEKQPFAEMLVDLCERIAPTISIVDGITAMEGNGPTGGSPRFVGVLGVSENPYALDDVCCRVVGIDPQDVLYLAHAVERGLYRPQEIETLGASVQSLYVSDFKMPDSASVDFLDRLPRFLRPMASKLTTPRPYIPKSKCVGCGKCAESCPVQTITIRNHKAQIDPSKCIRCFCCHEMCPQHIVEIRRFSLFNL